MDNRTHQIPLIAILFCYLALTQVYRFAHVHAIETDDGYEIEWSLHKVLHPHDHDYGNDGHQEEVDHLIGDWDHIHSLQVAPPPLHVANQVHSFSPEHFVETILVDSRTGPPPLPPNLSATPYRGPPLT